MAYSDPEKRRQWAREWRAKNLEAERARNRARYAADPDGAAKQRDRRAADRAADRAYHRDYYARRKDDLRQYAMDYWRDHADAKRAYFREWKATHHTPPRDYAYRANRQAKKYGPAEKLDWRLLDGGPCVYCGVDGARVSWDHVIPLAVGGANSVANVVRCCFECNRRKYARTPEQWNEATADEVTEQRRVKVRERMARYRARRRLEKLDDGARNRGSHVAPTGCR